MTLRLRVKLSGKIVHALSIDPTRLRRVRQVDNLGAISDRDPAQLRVSDLQSG